MKKALILALITVAACTNAADITVSLGNLVVPSAAVANVVEWLDSEVLYKTAYSNEFRTNPDTGEIVTVRTRVQTVVAETPKQKIVRIASTAARETVVSKFRAWHDAKQEAIAQAAQDAAMAALPAPVQADVTTTVAATTAATTAAVTTTTTVAPTTVAATTVAATSTTTTTVAQ